MKTISLMGSYYWSSEKFGTHDIVAGIGRFNDVRIANNYQSPSNFYVWNYEPPQFDSGGEYYPVFVGGENLDYWPIFAASRGTDFTTNSVFVNDTWRANHRLSFNVRLRYDKNDGLHTQFDLRPSAVLSVGGNWTWSHARGNFDGETSGAGPVAGNPLNFPEYQQESWSYPSGDLGIDQRHKVRVWAI